MKPEDKEKTFTINFSLYQFTVMCFILSNACFTFERLIENWLKGLQWIECLLYMDDIISPCCFVEQGLARLENIF